MKYVYHLAAVPPECCGIEHAWPWQGGSMNVYCAHGSMAGWQHGRVALPDSSGVMLGHPNLNPSIGLERDSSMISEAENYIALAYRCIR